MKNLRTYYFLLPLFGLLACVKPYDFEVEQFDRLLVIDGAITNNPGPHAIEISYTYPLESRFSERVGEATVWVEDQNGQQTFFEEERLGIYLSPEDFQGEFRSTYQLYVELNDGSQYVSKPETLSPSPTIDSVYARLEYSVNDFTQEREKGVQFFIDMSNEFQVHQYFRYEWEDAYKIVVPTPASFDVQLIDDQVTFIPLQEDVGTCYLENSSKELIFTSTVGRAGDQVLDFPIHFVAEDKQEFRERYMILVRQHAISESAYLFYKGLQENNESGGSLFDQQTGSIFGNISSVDPDGDQVLGYFEASGVSEIRRFYDFKDLPEGITRAPFGYGCFNPSVNTSVDSALYYLNITNGNVVQYDDSSGRVLIESSGCSDCSTYANLEPPLNWEE
ncbi:MAG: DUF4249 domain-containing protein [Cyclobacteriaceae bacterium]